jgi:hypothetical protein
MGANQIRIGSGDRHWRQLPAINCLFINRHAFTTRRFPLLTCAVSNSGWIVLIYWLVILYRYCPDDHFPCDPTERQSSVHLRSSRAGPICPISMVVALIIWGLSVAHPVVLVWRRGLHHPPQRLDCSQLSRYIYGRGEQFSAVSTTSGLSAAVSSAKLMEGIT